MYIFDALQDDGLLVARRFLQRQVLVPLKHLPPHQSASHLFIGYNSSETRACVASFLDPSNDYGCQLLPYFPNQVVPPQFLPDPMKASQLALPPPASSWPSQMRPPPVMAKVRRRRGPSPFRTR